MQPNDEHEVDAQDVISSLQRRIGSMATELALAESLLAKKDAKIAALQLALTDTQASLSEGIVKT